MALATILRSVSRNQGGTLQALTRTAPLILNKQVTPPQRQYSVLSKEAKKISLESYASNVLKPCWTRNMSGDHSKLWTIEKSVSVGLLGLVPAAIAFPNPLLDNLAAVAVVAHFHWGLEAVVVDYARPIILGNVLAKLILALLYLLTGTTLGGLIYYNLNDIGIGKTIQKLWAIKE